MSDPEPASETEAEGKVYAQAGVIATREVDGAPAVCMVTSRSGKRWVIPKGLVDPGRTAQQSAANEALEEAGIAGRIDPQPLGRYRYAKWGGECVVDVFRMHVDRIDDAWLEDWRTREWVPIHEAASRVREKGLKALIAALAER